MPVLQDLRHEAFARARAKGALLDDAYEDAGFRPGNHHASRLADRREVAERIAEVRAEQSVLTDANTQAVIAALLRIATASEALGPRPVSRRPASPCSKPASWAANWRGTGPRNAPKPLY